MTDRYHRLDDDEEEEKQEEGPGRDASFMEKRLLDSRMLMLKSTRAKTSAR